MTEKQLSQQQKHSVRFELRSNLSFNALSDLEMGKLLRMCNLTAKVLGRTALSTTVLNRLSSEERRKLNETYDEGTFVSLCTDGWKTPFGMNWVGFCGLLRCMDYGEVIIDVARF